jgi:glycosyltransferase involved in cell wall biosynthesis
MPSLREGFGLVVLEGWRAGRPTIGSQVGGVAELIENGKNGRLVPPGDANVLAGAMVELLENPNLAQTMGERGRLETLPDFSIEKMVQETENIYAKLSER